MYETKKRIQDLRQKFESFKKTIDLEAKQTEFNSLQAKSADSDLWANPDNAKKLMQNLSDVKNELEEIKSLNEDISILEELPLDEKEIKKLEERLEKLTLKTYLNSPYDKKNAILSVHAGQGGTEAMDWTSMLFRMYVRYCEKVGYKTEILDETRGEEAGFKSITIKVEDSYAYGYLKGESGTHRLVRQSPFNADNLRQTSFASVEVLPEFEEVDLPDIQIKDEDLDWQFFRAGSQGGQNVNKVSTAVRLTHKPTGIVVTAQTERFQEQNRKIALNLLRSKLWLRSQELQKQEKKNIKGEYKPASWGTQIRSYVLHPYKMVKDLRTQVETSDTTKVLDGDLTEFIEAELKI
ncbi:peptide chain release factor 2 [Candidatus Woesebacteria bacterium]|nr:peptide chain release factor 2 [Candidatus Woesebacteria bacterium]QQG47922.1 MAG: peptide chain release factor 2 [Candidatus Woesebacteria bacterium]